MQVDSGRPLDNRDYPQHNSGHMADSSFDIVSEINLQEMDNAVTQAQKEIGTRYDFKGTAASIEFNRKEKELTFTADAPLNRDGTRPIPDQHRSAHAPVVDRVTVTPVA